MIAVLKDGRNFPDKLEFSPHCPTYAFCTQTTSILQKYGKALRYNFLRPEVCSVCLFSEILPLIFSHLKQEDI